MLKTLAQWIFMDKRGRAAAKKLRDADRKSGRSKGKAAGASASPAENPQAAEAASGEREALLKETMALYRQRREEYEQLDEETQERLVKLAAGKRPDEDG